jgi:hypothetical protein
MYIVQRSHGDFITAHRAHSLSSIARYKGVYMITALSIALFNCVVNGKTRWEETFAAYACRPSMAIGVMN